MKSIIESQKEQDDLEFLESLTVETYDNQKEKLNEDLKKKQDIKNYEMNEGEFKLMIQGRNKYIHEKEAKFNKSKR